jgi:Family of unknown function (DUF5752)
VTMNGTYELTGVVHLVRPAFRQAGSLDELRDGIAAADAATLFCHAVQCLLRSPTGEPPPDDFSAWVNGVVQDRETAERMSFAVQRAGAGAASLQASLLKVLDATPAAARRSRIAPEGGAFVFLSLDSVPVPTGVLATDGEELFTALLRADDSVWFRELIEQPWFDQGPPAASVWLRAHGDTKLAGWVDEAAHSGRSIEGMQRLLHAKWSRRRIGARIAEAADRSDYERREAGRSAVASLVRRLRKDEEAS